MSPGWSVGARTRSTYVWKMTPFMGRSTTKGAVMPSWRRPATKVVVFQCPWGTRPIRRAPRRLRPRVRAMLVLAQVSSMKTSRLGSSVP